MHLLVHRGGRCSHTCFPVRSACKLLFPTFLPQSGPRLPRVVLHPGPASWVQTPCPWAGNQHDTPMPSLPGSSSPGVRTMALDPHRPGVHRCCSEKAPIQYQHHETIMLFNGERYKCSQSSSISPRRKPEDAPLPRPEGWGRASWGRDARKVSLAYKGGGGQKQGS